MRLLNLVLLMPLSFCAAQSALPASQPDQNRANLVIEVVDPQGARIAKANILDIPDNSRAKVLAITDSDGRAIFRDLPAGTYTFAVSARGFSTSAQTIELSTPQTTIKITLEIAANEIRQDEYVTRGVPIPIDETIFNPEITPLPIEPLPKIAPLTEKKKRHWKGKPVPPRRGLG